MKELLKRLNELFKSFIYPIQPQKSFKEEALALGLAPNAVAELEASMTWGENYKFDEGNEETKKIRKQRTSSVETTQIQAKPRTTVIERKDGFGRED